MQVLRIRRWSKLVFFVVLTYCTASRSHAVADSFDQEVGRIKRSIEELSEVAKALQNSIQTIEEQTEKTAVSENPTTIATIDSSDVERSIFTMNVDGSKLKPLYPMPEYAGQGSPAWSPDGNRIAFDAWRPQDDEQAHVFIVNNDGVNVHSLGPGSMPNWSPLDDAITLCRHGNKWGTWRVNASGEDSKIVHAFNPQWSPDGNQLAIITPPGVGLAVCDKHGSHLERVAPHIAPGIGWSPDGKYICGAREHEDGQYEMVIISMQSSTWEIKIRLKGDFLTQMKWSPDGKWIVFSMRTDQLRNHQLYIVAPHGSSPPLLIKGQDPRRSNMDPAWSPNGKQLAFASNPVPYEE